MAFCPNCRNELPATPVDRCPSCGAAVVAGGEAAAAGTPWDARDRTGVVTALVDTTRLVLTRPGEFFRAMPVSGGIGNPLLYAVILGWAGLIVANLYQAIFHSIVGTGLAALADRPQLAALLSWTQSWVGFAVQVVFGGIFVAIGVFIWSAVVHVVLLLLGGARNGFEATFRVICFAHATNVLLILPFCGQFVVLVWTLVVDVIGLAEAQRISHGRAAAAVLLPIVLLCCCCAGFAMLFAGAIAGLASHLR